ncbi:MAG TPA: PDZ domain-containing protein [Thermoanaerobaculia bacterium]
MKAAALGVCLVLALDCQGGGVSLEPGTLGASFQNANSLREDGAVLQEVVETGPAARAGLRSGDLILGIDGTPVNGVCAFEHELSRRNAGEEVRLSVRRGPEILEKTIKLARARAFCEKACDDGLASGCYLLGVLHAKGAENGLANQRFKQACRDGSAEACGELGGRLLQGIKESAEEAFIFGLVRTGCDGGSAQGCAYLAYLYATGERGIPKNDAQALVLYDKACHEGDSNACYNAGLHFEKGRGTLADEGRALTAYQRACDLGSALGCTNAGFLHERGFGVHPDVMRAALAYRRACEGTVCGNVDPLACFNLGVLYRDGEGVKQDKATAVKLFTRSCAKGNSYGCANLADLYHTGDGVTQDLEYARELYKMACSLEHEGACEFLKEMEQSPGSAGVPPATN